MLMDTGFLSRGEENVLKLIVVMVVQLWILLKTIDLYTLRGWILRYVDFILIKLLLKEKS